MVYLDNNATTPLDPVVAEKMCWFLKEHFGNPSSLYPIGRAVKDIITEARETVAAAIGAQRSELVFTGSGTEADNFAIRGVLDTYPEKDEIITSAVEHPAVLRVANFLENTVGVIDLDPTHVTFRRMVVRIGLLENLVRN